MSDFSFDAGGESVPMRQPYDQLAVNFGMYVHGRGFWLRAFGVPGTDPVQIVQKLHDAGHCEEHTRAAVWVFIAYFPEQDGERCYNFVTFDMHMAVAILEDPRILRLYGNDPEGAGLAEFIPLNPKTHDAYTSIAEFNNWIGSRLDGEERVDFRESLSLDFDAIEDMLKGGSNE